MLPSWTTVYEGKGVMVKGKEAGGGVGTELSY